MDTDLSILQDYHRTRDPDMFTRLVERHAAMVHAVAWRVTRNAADADDVTQECFLDLTRQAIRVHTSVAAWLHAAATHRALNLLRRAGRDRAASLRAAEQAKHGGAGEADARSPSWHEIAPLLDQVLEDLPDDLRQPVILHFLEGRAQAEVAELLAVSQPTVSRRIEEGLARLRQALQARGVERDVPALGASLLAGCQIALPGPVKLSLAKIGLVGIGHRAAIASAAAPAAPASTLPLLVVGSLLLVGITTAGTWCWQALHAPVAVVRPLPAPAAVGTWSAATPSGLDLTYTAFPDNYGIQDVLSDPAHPGTLYAFSCHQGLWTSSDGGLGWRKVANSGRPLEHGKASSAAMAPDGGYLLAAVPDYSPLSIYRSGDGGRTWTEHAVPIPIYAIAIDPLDQAHVVASGSESDRLIESTDGGRSWSDHGPIGSAGGDSYALHVLDRATLLAVGQADHGADPATWRATRSPAGWSWTRVSGQRHRQGSHQLVIDREQGVIYNPGCLGIERSDDLGRTWSLASGIPADVVVGTPTMLYAGCSFPVPGAYDPHLQHARRTQGARWSADPTPPGMSNGPRCFAVTRAGADLVIVSGNWLAGIWRYVEPASAASASASTSSIPP